MSIIVQVGALRPLTSGPDSTLSVSPHSDEIDMSSGPSGDIYQRTVHTHSYPGCFGLPYQDHNYGAPPPITPPPSPTLPTVKINGHIEIIEDVSKPTLIAKEEIIDDSITRCICEFQHDDGYMICCDRCSVWQHIDCMGIDRNNIPESYYCELCQIRPVDIERAKIIQSRKKEELANLDTSATDTDPEELANRLAALEKKSPYKKVTKQRRNSKLKDKMGTKQKNGKEKKGLKKEKENLKIGNLKIKFKNAKDGSQKAVKQKNRHNSQTVVKVNGDSWNYEGFDRFEDAKENQYSKDVQELFSKYNVNGINLDDKHCDSERLLDQLWCLGQTIKKQVIIEAKEPILPGLAVLEYKGIVLLRQHYVDTNLFFKIAHPHVLFYSKFEDIDLCIDSSSYGNKARYIRRSCSPNAEVRHLVEHGRIHFVIFSTKEVDKGEEITIPFDYNYQECMYCVECACLRNNCTVSKFWKKMTKNSQNKVNVKKPRMKRPSGSTDITIKTEQLSPLKNEILKIKESIPQSPSPIKTIKKVLPLPTTPIKQEPKPPVMIEKTLPIPPPVKHSPPKAAVKHTPKPHPKPTPVARVKHDSGSSDKTCINTAVSPTLSTPEKQEPEEPDHKMTREERKMNAIMKAFEKLEKREERRKEALARIDGGRKSQDEPKKVPTEIRISSEEESKTCTSEEVSDSKDETFKPETPQKNQRKGRKRPLRRRSRVNSMSAAEPPPPPVETLTVQQVAQSTPTTPLPPDSASPGSMAAGFKFLKTKKHLFNEWLTEKGNEPKTVPAPPPPPLEIKVPVDETIFVPCLPSPRNAMDHLQRRNSQSSGCGRTGAESNTRGSAKKRWLRQAMHEVPSTSENGSVSPVLGCTSPNPGMCSPTPGTNPVIGSPTHGASPSSSPPVDFVTPLKKRRLARESLSQDAPILSSTPSTPSTSVDTTMTTTINKVEGIDNEATSTGNIDNVSGQVSNDPVASNVSKCYTSDSTESEAENSLSKVTVPETETLTDGENLPLSDNNSALNITADSGVVTDSHLDTPEKMEVDSVTTELEKTDSSSVDELNQQEIDLKKGENIFDNLKNLSNENTSDSENSNLKNDIQNGCESSENKLELVEKDFEMAVTPKIAENIISETAIECSENSKSANTNTPSDVNTSPQDKDFALDSEATQIIKENGFICKSLSHNLGKTESFGFIPSRGENISVSPSKDVDSLTKEDQIETKSANDIVSTTSVTLPVHLDNKMPLLEPSNQVVLTNIPSSSLNKTILSSEIISSDTSLDNNVVAPGIINMAVSGLSCNIVIPTSISSIPLSSEALSVSPPSNEQTQPCKKKVSLLEYRKRLKTKCKDTSQPQSSISKAVNSILSTRLGERGNYTPHTIRSRNLPSLPSLPLFTDRNKKKKEVKEKKSWHDLSLTERLRQEFGVEASEDGNNSDDSREGSLTPPPPPPPPCQTSPSPRLLKYLEGDDKTVIQSGIPPPPTAPHPGRGPATPPPPPPPPKSTSNRIPSLMSLPFTTRPTTPLGVGATASQLLPLPTQTLGANPASQTTAVLVNYPAQNGTSATCQGTSPQTLSYHHQVAVNPHQPVVNATTVFPVTQGTSPQSYSTSSSNNLYNNRYRRNSSPSTTSHHKGREVPFSHSYNHTSDTISRSEWSNGRRNTYSKYH